MFKLSQLYYSVYIFYLHNIWYYIHIPIHIFMNSHDLALTLHLHKRILIRPKHMRMLTHIQMLSKLDEWLSRTLRLISSFDGRAAIMYEHKLTHCVSAYISTYKFVSMYILVKYADVVLACSCLCFRFWCDKTYIYTYACIMQNNASKALITKLAFNVINHRYNSCKSKVPYFCKTINM